MSWKTFLLPLAFLGTISPGLSSPDAPANFRNPILAGFYPDPSVCRVGDTYYLVNSSFAWFPGVPIHRSRDLVNWEQIGHVLDRPSQLNLKDNVGVSAGVWAPTLRYHDGQFYLITTAQRAGQNFYVTATDPAGPWSDPHFLPEAPGIDPTLFFDDDGRVYYVGNFDPKEKQRWKNQHEIWLQQIDLATDRLVGERHVLTAGDHVGFSMYAEGPHLYKINGKYLLLISEGGTWERHAITVFLSDRVTGPYERHLDNPVLTHRHLGTTADITTTGHADLVQTQNGDWWAVLLGVRPFGPDRHYTLGRETFLVPVRFEDNWPVFAPNVGRVRREETRPDLPWTPVPAMPARDEFTADKPGLAWNFLRTPQSTWWSLTARPGWLTLPLRAPKLTETGQPSLIARRVQHHHFTATTRLDFAPAAANEVAGLVVLQNESFHYRLEVGRHEGRRTVILHKVSRERPQPAAPLHEEVVGRLPLPGTGPVVLRLQADELDLRFLAGPDESRLTPVGGTQDGRLLSTRTAGGFVGAYVGMYASCQGETSANTASFDWFDYRGATEW